jgi:hypothetical protein
MDDSDLDESKSRNKRIGVPHLAIWRADSKSWTMFSSEERTHFSGTWCSGRQTQLIGLQR